VQQVRVLDQVLRGALDRLDLRGGELVALDHQPHALGDLAAAATVQ
jgi:hypothetical protein